ncbi:MAG: hypothetical protein QM477_09940 [Planctomycetota bacterium]
MMRIRFHWVLIVAIVAATAFWKCGPGLGSANAAVAIDSPPTIFLAPVVNSGVGYSREEVWAKKKIRFVDRLALDFEVPVESVAFRCGDTTVKASEASIPQALLDCSGGGYWEVHAPNKGGSIYIETSLAKSRLEGGEFAVGFRPGLRVGVRDTKGRPLLSAPSVHYSIMDSAEFAEIKLQSMNSPKDELWARGSLDQLLGACENRIDGFEVIPLELESSEQIHVLDSGGVMLIWASAEGYNQAWREVLVSPGKVTDLELLLQPRPVVFGKVFDSNSEPIPYSRLFITVSFGENQRPDISSADNNRGVAIISGGLPGAMQRTARLRTKTDEEGFYSVKVPRGEYYGASLRKDESFGFSRTTEIDFGQLDRIELNLELQDSDSSPAGYYLEVIDQAGRPVRGAEIGLAIVDDLDWIRDFPKVVSDERGKAFYPWVSAGTRVSPIVSLNGEDIRKGVSYLTLNTGHTTIEVFVSPPEPHSEVEE